VICHNLLLSNYQYISINSIVENDTHLLNPTYMLKISKPASYLTFIMNEIYEFINRKSEDGILINNLRKCKNEYLRIKDKIEKISDYFG
jgi:hypothetical protein